MRRCGRTFTTGSPLRVTVLGGGNGISALLRGLVIKIEAGDPIAVTAVVATADDGGSSGRLRRERGGLPPGDLRNCLVALSPSAGGPIPHLFSHRYGGSGPLGGHVLGNLMLTALAEREGCYLKAVEVAGKMLHVRGRVLPASLESVRLLGETRVGDRIAGESRIGSSTSTVHRVWLDPSDPEATPGVIEAIERADLVVLGPGSLFTSLLPVALVAGVADAIRASRGERVLVANLMTEPGETAAMDLNDHLQTLDRHLGAGLVGHVLLNEAPIAADRLKAYALQRCAPVAVKARNDRPENIVKADLVTPSGKIRHDPERLAGALLDLLARARIARDDSAGSARLQSEVPRRITAEHGLPTQADGGTVRQ